MVCPVDPRLEVLTSTLKAVDPGVAGVKQAERVAGGRGDVDGGERAVSGDGDDVKVGVHHDKTPMPVNLIHWQVDCFRGVGSELSLYP